MLGDSISGESNLDWGGVREGLSEDVHSSQDFRGAEKERKKSLRKEKYHLPERNFIESNSLGKEKCEGRVQEYRESLIFALWP